MNKDFKEFISIILIGAILFITTSSIANFKSNKLNGKNHESFKSIRRISILMKK